jgi:RHS repeat-associated protein
VAQGNERKRQQGGRAEQGKPFRYRGDVYDEETALYCLRSRYYDPEWGRFLNADMVLGSGGRLNHNLFAYCGNQPILRNDKNGKTWYNEGWEWVPPKAQDAWNWTVQKAQNVRMCFLDIGTSVKNWGAK